jgi:hypothetical protein
MTVAETRRVLGCCETTVESLVRRGYLEKIYLLTAVRFRESEVQAILDNGTRSLPRRVIDVAPGCAYRGAAGR